MSQAVEKKKKRKPLRRAQRWGSQVLPMAGKMLTVLVAVAVLGMMFSALQTLESDWMRIVLSLMIASGMLVMNYGDGLNKGSADALQSRSYVRLEASGNVMSAKDDARCYHPLKALCACTVVYAIPLAMAAYVALTAKPYTYALQDLPAWLTDSYGQRADVMAPLAAYSQTNTLTAADWVRMLVRVMELIYVNLFNDPQTMALTIDRLSPLFILTYPAAYMLGYLSGPRRGAKVEAMNRRAKKVAVRKQQKSSLVEELLGARPDVHYGQRVETAKKKKKELI